MAAAMTSPQQRPAPGLYDQPRYASVPDSRGSRSISGPPGGRVKVPGAGDLAELWEDDNDESFEKPAFFFDWDAIATKPGDVGGTGTGAGASGLLSSARGPGGQKDKERADELAEHLASLKLSTSSIAGGSAAPRRQLDRSTPPSNPPQAASVHSSASSARMSALTDASTASASSLAPTPPAADAGVGEGERALGRAYGRRFQRVVSAPVASDRSSTRATSGQDPDMSASTNTTHTSTLRPGIMRTVSGSHNDLTASTSTATDRQDFVTPGLTGRILKAGPTSTGRRLGSLARFGRPQRGVIHQPDLDEETEEGRRSSPVLIDSPKRTVQPQRSPRASASPAHRTVDRTHPAYEQASPGGTRRLSPTNRHNENQTSSKHSSDWRAANLPEEAKPFRPFRTTEQENQRDYPDERSALNLLRRSIDHRDASGGARAAPQSASASLADDVGEQRLGHASTSTLRASRPAPPIHAVTAPISLVPVQPVTQTTVPVQLVPNSTAPLAQQHAVVTTQPVVITAQKRSFQVNGQLYERLGTLGSGGSSKVYQVIGPDRVVYALKRVALDRADPETYQSYTNEIELLKRLRGHDRIIQLIENQMTYSQSNKPKMLMMIMECGELDFATLLDEQKGKPLNMNFVGMYWEQMLEAVHAVHQENVVHTDLKPANFVLVKGRLKIIDFGIAKAIANDTVNIQRDQMVGTVNYMSPEAIQRMNGQAVLKLSFPSDVWSLGCILYQMIYGSPPFAHIGGGPLPKMNAIANPSHHIEYPAKSMPKSAIQPDGQVIDPNVLAVSVIPTAIDCMKRCLAYRKEYRLTILELLKHEFLRPKISAPAVPTGSTFITESQMAMLVNYILRDNGLPGLSERDSTAADLFSQLQAQNSLSS